MNRLQISDDFGNERLVTQARPIAQTQATQGQEAWQGLANAFAAGDMLVETVRKQKEQEDTQRATAYANSLTVDELGKKIKSGEMRASESPVFAAVTQNIWGQNTRAALERDVLSKVSTGEVTFNSPAEIDDYLTQYRNTELAGQSKYAVAGFDKQFPELREKLMGATAQVNDKAMVEQAATEAADSLGNTLNRVSAGDFKGTPQEAVTEVMNQYHLLRKTKVMPEGASRGALLEVVTRAAASGKTDLVTGLLNTELPDIGSVRSMLGSDKAATLEAQATTRYDGIQRQRVDEESLPFYLSASEGRLPVEKFMGWATGEPNKKYISSAMINSLIQTNLAAQARAAEDLRKAQLQGVAATMEYDAQKRVDAALSNGTLWEVQGTNTPQVMTSTGAPKDFDVKGYAEQALKAKTANLPFDQQVSAWAMNGLTNPDWSNQLRAGLNNLASIGVDSKGKPVGELNGAGTEAIRLFKELDATSPDAARQTAGEEAYKRFSDIAFLMRMGREPADAASIASRAASGATLGGDTVKRAGQIAAVADMTTLPWLDWLANTRDGAWDVVKRNNPLALAGALAYGVANEVGGPGTAPEWLKLSPGNSAMRNSTPNTAQVHSWVRRYATLLAHSGDAGDAEGALKVAVSYLSDPKVSVKVNGTLYLRSEMPTPPGQGQSPELWLERFLDAGPKAQATAQGFAGAEVRLEYDERARVYRAFMGGLPMSHPDGQGLMVFSRNDIQKWYATEHQKDIAKATSTASYESYRARLQAEIPGLQKGDRYAIERYDKSFYGRGMEKQLLSREAFERIRKDGNAMKPLAELMRQYPTGKN